MEVIHRYNGFYPFDLQEESDQTYLQVLKENLSEQQINAYRRRYKTIKGIDHTNLIKLVRIYKEQSKLHLLYEYFPFSLEKYVQHRSQNCKESDKDQYKQIYAQFATVIASIIDIFVKFQIKTEIIIQNFAVVDLQNGQLKLFVDPQAEFIGLDVQNQDSDQSIRLNQMFLQEFYLAEKKRITMQFEQILEKYFGKNNTATQLNRPNFIINGSKLVFINNHNHEPRNIDKQHRNEHFAESVQERQGAKPENKKQVHSSSPVKTEKSQLKRDLKEKTLKKLTQIKSVLNRFQTKPPEQYKIYPQASDEIVFRPEEITNDKTALLQENQYLESLQNEIENINEAKKQKQERKSEEKRADIIKQINQLQQKNKKYSEMLPKDPKAQYQYERPNQISSSERFKDNKFSLNSKNDSNLSKNDSRNNDKSANSANSEEYPKFEEKKDQKSNKYKMKIITSHEIEIQGAGEPQARQVEKDILEGIKSGKINISEASQKPQRPKTVKLQTEQANRFQQKKKNSGQEVVRLNSRNSDIASKSKKINEIIQKINSKSNINNQMSNSSHHPDQKIDNTQTLSSYKSNNVETLEHPQDNYYDKIRQAKNKAQQVLKEYAKKKQ